MTVCPVTYRPASLTSHITAPTNSHLLSVGYANVPPDPTGPVRYPIDPGCRPPLAMSATPLTYTDLSASPMTLIGDVNGVGDRLAALSLA
jgi:hypothetical protein